MSGKTRKVWKAVVPIKDADGERTWWHKIGVACDHQEGKISVRLNSLPIGEGGVAQFWLFPEEPKP